MKGLWISEIRDSLDGELKNRSNVWLTRFAKVGVFDDDAKVTGKRKWPNGGIAKWLFKSALSGTCLTDRHPELISRLPRGIQSAALKQGTTFPTDPEPG